MNRVPLGRLVAEIGASPSSLDDVRRILDGAGLRLGDEDQVDGRRLDEVRALLLETSVRVCSDGHCRAIARERTGASIICEVVPAECSVCFGSANERGVARVLSALRRSGLSHVVVVGGGTDARNYLDGYYMIDWGPDRGSRRLFRLVDGTIRHTRAMARKNLAWADLVIVWAPTPLDHAVSDHYTDPTSRHRLTVACRSHGLAAMCDEVVSYVARNPSMRK